MKSYTKQIIDGNKENKKFFLGNGIGLSSSQSY